MKLTSREALLAWLTGVTLVLAGTYWFAQPRLQELKDLRKATDALSLRKKEAELLLGRRSEVDGQLAAVRRQLPVHPIGKDVTADFLRTLERLASQNGISLLRREAEPERSTGDIREVSINCNWEGTLDALVRFLYALQTQGAMLDVQQLTVSPIPGGHARLKGTFTVDFAYTREAAAESSSSPQDS